MPNFISDADMEKMSSSSGNKKFISDAEMDALDTQGSVEQTTHPDISYLDRLAVKNFSSSPEAGISYLQKKHPKLEFASNNGEITVRTPGQSRWNVVDPDTGFFSKDMLADAGDLLYDVGSGALNAGATVLGAAGGTLAGMGVGSAPGAFLGGAAAGGASSAALEHLRQKIGEKAFDMEGNISSGDTIAAGIGGAAAPMLLGTGATVAKAGAKGLTERLSTKMFGEEAVKKSAEKSASQGLIGRAYDGTTRKVIPAIAEMTSGIEAESFRNYIRNQANFDKLSEKRLVELSNMAGNLGEQTTKEGTELRKLLGKNLGEARQGIDEIDVSAIKNMIKTKKEELLSQRNVDPADIQALDDIYSELFHYKAAGASDVERIGADDIFAKIKTIEGESLKTIKALKERKAQLEDAIVTDPQGVNLRAGLQGVQSPYTELSQVNTQISQIENIFGERTKALQKELSSLPAKELGDTVDFKTAQGLREKFNELAKFYQSNSKGARLKHDIQIGKEGNALLRQSENELTNNEAKTMSGQFRQSVTLESDLNRLLSSFNKDSGQQEFGKSLSQFTKLAEGKENSATLAKLLDTLKSNRKLANLPETTVDGKTSEQALRDILTLRDLGDPSYFHGFNKDMPVAIRTIGLPALGGSMAGYASGDDTRGKAIGTGVGFLSAVAALNPKTMKYAMKKAYNLEKKAGEKVGSKIPAALKNKVGQNALLQSILNAQNE